MYYTFAPDSTTPEAFQAIWGLLKVQRHGKNLNALMDALVHPEKPSIWRDTIKSIVPEQGAGAWAEMPVGTAENQQQQLSGFYRLEYEDNDDSADSDDSSSSSSASASDVISISGSDDDDDDDANYEDEDEEDSSSASPSSDDESSSNSSASDVA
jgi:hypothetical protein